MLSWLLREQNQFPRGKIRYGSVLVSCRGHRFQLQFHRHEISRRNKQRNLRRSVPISGLDSVAGQHVKVPVNHAVRYRINGPPAHVPRL